MDYLMPVGSRGQAWTSLSLLWGRPQATEDSLKSLELGRCTNVVMVIRTIPTLTLNVAKPTLVFPWQSLRGEVSRKSKTALAQLLPPLLWSSWYSSWCSHPASTYPGDPPTWKVELQTPAPEHQKPISLERKK